MLTTLPETVAPEPESSPASTSLERIQGNMKPKLTGKRCRCAGCGETFSTPANFDKHRDGPWTARVCLEPSGAGLCLGADGLWREPGKNINGKQAPYR